MQTKDISPIISLWGEKPLEVKTVRDVYQVTTNVGKRCLKEVTGNVDRILFMIEAMNFVYSNGFTRLARCLPSTEGKIWEEMNGANFMVQEWLDGLEPDYRKADQMVLAAETIALFHQAGVGFKPNHNKGKNKLGKWPAKLERKIKDLEIYIRTARGAPFPTDFEKIMLNYSDWMLNNARISIKKLNNSRYMELVKEEQNRGCLVHGDTATRNFILKNNSIYLIDFDSIAIDINLADLWRLLRRTLRREQWDMDFANGILRAYSHYVPLKSKHREILLAFLYFPEKPWRIIKEYYEKREAADWDEGNLTERLYEYSAHQKNINRFFKDFEKNI